MEKTTVIQMQSTLCVRDMPQAFATLVSALDENDSITVAIPADAAVDLSLIQLLEAARLRGAELGKTLVLSTPAQGEVRRALERSGLLATANKGDLQFWLHGETAQ